MGSGSKQTASKASGTRQFVCAECGTDISPEWRKGPLGPKTYSFSLMPLDYAMLVDFDGPKELERIKMRCRNKHASCDSKSSSKQALLLF